MNSKYINLICLEMNRRNIKLIVLSKLWEEFNHFVYIPTQICINEFLDIVLLNVTETLI